MLNFAQLLILVVFKLVRFDISLKDFFPEENERRRYISKYGQIECFVVLILVSRCVHAFLYEALSMRPWSVARFFFKPRKLIGNGTEPLEKSIYGSLTANNLPKICNK